MSRVPTVPRTRMLASLAVLAVLAVVAAGGWIVASGMIGVRDEEIATKTDLLADLRARALPVSRTGAGPRVPPEAAFLSGETEAIAGNRLQERVTGAVEEAGGTRLSVGVTNVEDGIGGARKITADIGFETTIEGLQKALFTLEAGVPYIFIDGLVVTPQEAGSGARPGRSLRAAMTISGYWRPASPAPAGASGT